MLRHDSTAIQTWRETRSFFWTVPFRGQAFDILRLELRRRSLARNMAITPRVILLASRNGKVIFPSWLRPGTLFLGKASTGREVGPCPGPVTS
jgi:hypothetical protein